MITQTQEISICNINASNKTISISKCDVFLNDGVEIARSQPWMRAFAPGEIDIVKEVTGWGDETPEIIYLNSIWTEEVINSYKDILENQHIVQGE